MWVIRADPVEQPIISFHDDPCREGRVARELLSGYQGFVQMNADAGYNALETMAGITHVGDWDHVHRRFAKAVQASKKVQGKGRGKKLSHAETALLRIKRLYAKAWLFCGSPRGAEASGVIYSIIETAVTLHGQSPQPTRPVAVGLT